MSSEELVERCGLARLIAVGVVRRACTRAGVSTDEIAAQDLPRVIDAMEPLLAVYLPRPEVAARMAALRSLAR